MQPLHTALRDPQTSGTDAAAEEAPARALAKLQTRTADSLAGFRKMLEKAEPHFRPTVTAFIDLHERQADALARLLLERGHEMDADGSWMSTMQRAVIAVRSTVDDIDEGTLPQVRMGELQILALYDDAIEETRDAAQRGELARLREDLRALTDRLAPES